MARDARLALADDLRQLADGELGTGAQHKKAQPGRLRHRAQGRKYVFPIFPPHLAGDLIHINISLYARKLNIFDCVTVVAESPAGIGASIRRGNRKTNKFVIFLFSP